MNKFATIIINRNLPKITDKLFNYLKKTKKTDIFVVEAGSDKSKLSKNFTWHANWKSAKKKGLRFPRGMNYALSNLWNEKKFKRYEFFFLITNDTEINTNNLFSIFEKIFKENPRLGILSGCSNEWGEKKLLKKIKMKYFWYIHNNAIVLRRNFIEEIISLRQPGYMNFLYDGKNFRGYGTESELIAKAYSNYWAAGITSEVEINENESYLINKSNLIKTEPYEKNLKLLLIEGSKWMREKYGFKSKWSMQMYTKTFYDRFFEHYPKYIKYKI